MGEISPCEAVLTYAIIGASCASVRTKGCATPIPAFLDYPPSGSSNVAIGIGEIIEKGADVPGVGVSITVSSPAGPVPLGTPTVAPSPYPTPFATPPPTFGAPYIAIPLPTLSPSTTYTVNDVYTDWADNPPVCSAQYTQFVGTFTTGP
jgi:hypothetical protein